MADVFQQETVEALRAGGRPADLVRVRGPSLSRKTSTAQPQGFEGGFTGERWE